MIYYNFILQYLAKYTTKYWNHHQDQRRRREEQADLVWVFEQNTSHQTEFIFRRALDQI